VWNTTAPLLFAINSPILTCFTNLAELRPGALVIGTDGFFISRSEHLAAMSVRHGVPAIFENREFVAAGGLMSYGGSLPDAYRLAGVYVARILKGERPGDLPDQEAGRSFLIWRDCRS